MNRFKFFLLTICMSIIVELASLVFFPHRPYLSSAHYGYSYDWFWELFALLGVCYFTYRIFYLEQTKILFFLFFAFLGTFISTQLFNHILENFQIKGNYYGIALENSQRGDRFLNGELFCSEADLSKSPIIDIARENNYTTMRRNFLFWQTGVAYGFEPDSRIQFSNMSVDFENKFILFLVVGPVALLEVVIREIYSNFLIIGLIQFIWFLKFRKTVL